MRIALTGVSGFIGSCIARHLHAAGHSVIGLVRPTSRRDHVEPYVERFVTGEQADEPCWDELLDGAECVIHNSVAWNMWKPGRTEGDLEEHLRSNLVGSIKLLDRAAPRQFIFMSTIAVHHEMSERWGGMIDEDHPLRPANLYGAYKAAVEAHLYAARHEFGMQTCAIRPCGVYGIDPRIERSHGHDLIQRIKRGDALDKPGGGKFVHVEDVAAATVSCVGNEDANGKVYNLVDCYARWADWAKMACEIMGVQREIDFSSPAQPKNTFSKDAAQSLGVSLNCGHEGIRSHLQELVTLMNV